MRRDEAERTCELVWLVGELIEVLEIKLSLYLVKNAVRATSCVVQGSGSGEGPRANDRDETRNNNLEILEAKQEAQCKGKDFHSCSGLANLLFNFGYTSSP